MASRKSKLHVTKTLEPDQPGAVRLTQSKRLGVAS